MEIGQYFGNDINLSASGDLLDVNGSLRTQQRLLRRLLTSPGSYIWHLNYGAGLGRFVGVNLSRQKSDEIKSLITSQLYLEESVAKQPAPVITLASVDGTTLSCRIIYYDAVTQAPFTLSFTVDR